MYLYQESDPALSCCKGENDAETLVQDSGANLLDVGPSRLPIIRVEAVGSRSTSKSTPVQLPNHRARPEWMAAVRAAGQPAPARARCMRYPVIRSVTSSSDLRGLPISQR